MAHDADNIPSRLDLIWGAEQISKAIGRTRRSTFDMLEKGELPAKKVNGRWVIERSKLVAFFMETAA
ncbi:helix-turn-helix domain-containing protein [Rhizobium leguminosarum]|uniref:helix-turn-helix domain-containing protein n=1 Tax=Rhizobium leguminosarum TaxID=384 RepID=UPI001C8FE8C8|nr:helix-turn-helix domain-containing protein [Rhizobium leguminosarum]MBY2921050.1 helix-turn-helix domain-containing protein [Rhizobium leguminosarum]